MIDCIKAEGAGEETEVDKLDAYANKDIHEQYEKVRYMFQLKIRDHGSTRSALALRREGDWFESRLNTAS